MTGSDDRRDRGSVMPMTVVLIAFLMIGAWALISAGQQWGARRDAYAAAAAAARAAAQADPDLLRAGVIVDEGRAAERAQAVLAAAGYTGSVVVDGAAGAGPGGAPGACAVPAPGVSAEGTGGAAAAWRRGFRQR